MSLLLVGAITGLRADDAGTKRAWELVGRSVDEAHRAFAGLAGTQQGAAARDAALGLAVTGFETQPFAEKNVTASQQQLRGLIAADANDETGIRARYELGRSRQLYHGASGPATENPEFAVLVREHPEHYLAQLAVVKLMLHRLYAVDADEPAKARLAAAESVRGQLNEAGLRGEYHLLLGDAYLFFGDQRAAALRHYREAERIGIHDSSARAQVLVQIGELARLEGDRALAIEAYRKFLADFSRDVRVLTIRRRLEEAERNPDATP